MNVRLKMDTKAGEKAEPTANATINHPFNIRTLGTYKRFHSVE